MKFLSVPRYCEIVPCSTDELLLQHNMIWFDSAVMCSMYSGPSIKAHELSLMRSHVYDMNVES